MSKTYRLIELMMTIHTKRKFTARGLAAEFGVSYRTILRDLDELSALGVPIYSEVGAHGGYYLLNDPILPPLIFTESEAAAMFFAYQSLQFFGALPFEAETRAALKKFYQQLPKQMQQRIDTMKDRIVFWHPFRPLPANQMNILLDAAITQSVVLIDYDGTNTASKRMIQPIGLYSWNGFWYCPAYCFKRQEFRLFRADRIVKAEKTDCEKARPLPYESVLSWIQTSENSCPDPVRLKAKLTQIGTRQALSDLDLLKIVDTHHDGTGSIDKDIPKAELEFFAKCLWNLGAEVIVTEPEEIKRYLQQKATKLLDHYQQS
ncbi:helix-turn-helix transcriptional regulator [Bacillus changyiensis]|uniref:helix-turn-helix transcriptional regulator n=1 Tax=Bacillus changyiensis TaxID=3004103 RepID=UPI0022E2C63F|nr:YafY family protein [Bacillus changyiensis]MDA1475871.1 YafY family protein [Bacillus changyiensis]